jgi:hypothetical protein
VTSRTTADQAALFPVSSGVADDHLPVVRPIALATRGRVEFTGRCPRCDGWHRHIHLGKVTGPCGARYRLEPKRTRRAA